jgi:hypothetical protein
LLSFKSVQGQETGFSLAVGRIDYKQYNLEYDLTYGQFRPGTVWSAGLTLKKPVLDSVFMLFTGLVSRYSGFTRTITSESDGGSETFMEFNKSTLDLAYYPIFVDIMAKERLKINVACGLEFNILAHHAVRGYTVHWADTIPYERIPYTRAQKIQSQPPVKLSGLVRIGFRFPFNSNRFLEPFGYFSYGITDEVEVLQTRIRSIRFGGGICYSIHANQMDT